MEKYKEIIFRAEEIRHILGLNKSRFSAKAGLSPQTYNNFTGSQGSKPNVQLIHGIVQAFNVNPKWLLDGTGEPFPTDDVPLERKNEDKMAPKGSIENVNQKFSQVQSKEFSPLREELALVLKPYRERKTPALNKISHPNNQVTHAIQVLTHHFIVSPLETAGQVMTLLNEFSKISDEMELVSGRISLMGKNHES